MIQLYKYLLLLLPWALVFSYHPVISLGGNETMNFELSLALIWLVVFDVVGFVLIVKLKLFTKTWQKWDFKKWLFLLFPVWVLLSIIWSLNTTRAILTAGVLILIYGAIAIMLTVTPAAADLAEFRARFLKWFFGAGLFVCVWCLVQCILDLSGVPREVSLLCPGCVTQMFGFPHPNGFAIEPQFMGNLLLAPTILSGYLLIKKFDKKLLILNLIFVSTLFLTFSRGAIYALVVALIFLTVFEIVRSKKFRALIIWPVVILGFLFTLNLQGVFAQVSNTNDTYGTGVAKVLNQLSLGIIDVRGADASDETEAEEENEAVFDGYVAESTGTRVRLTKAAVTIWRSDFKTALFGVGIGGAGQALYNFDLSPAPKEIVQNEYASLLLETGLIGVALFMLTMVLVVRAVIKNPANGMLLTLLVAYGITLCFFSGLPNALQIYLVPAALFVIYNDRRKKLVS